MPTRKGAQKSPESDSEAARLHPLAKEFLMKLRLMQRDPLWRELFDIVKASEEREEDWKPGGRVDQLKQCIERKYEEEIQVSRGDANGQPGISMSGEDVIRASWQTYDTLFPDDEATSSPRMNPPPRAQKAPRLFVEVDLCRIGLWDLDYLTKQFRGIVRAALKAMRKSARKEPPALVFLRRVRPEVFLRDLRRYDLHMTQGHSFRSIALVEVLERQGKTIRDGKRRVRHRVREESGVADSVHRVYQAIFRKRYNAKRRALDHPAEGVHPFSCPSHPNNTCDATCKHAQAWYKKVQRLLPSDMAGMLWSPKAIPIEHIEKIATSRSDARHKKPLPPA